MQSQTKTSNVKFPRFSKPTMGDMDAWYAGYAATVPAMAGSWLTFVFYAAALWALINLTYRRYTMAVPPRALPFILAGAILTVSMLISGLLSGTTRGLVSAVDTFAALLAAPLLIGRLRYSEPLRAWNMFARFAPLGALAGVSANLISGSTYGGAGNANVFATAMAILAIFSLVGAYTTNRLQQAIGILGFGLAAYGIIESGHRTLYPCIILFPFLALAFTRVFRLRYVAAIAVMLGALGAANLGVLNVQWADSLDDVDKLLNAQTETSLGIRVEMWKASLEAIAERPLLGHGPQNKMNVVRHYMDASEARLSFSHLHNGFIDAAVAGGLIGFAAFACLAVSPLLMVFGRKGERPERRFAGIAIFSMFGLISMTSVFLTHDLMIVLFVLPLALLAATDPDPRSVVLVKGRDRGTEPGLSTAS